MEYGGFWVSVVAYLIDAILLIIAAFVIQSLTGIDMGANANFAFNDAATSVGDGEASGTGSIVGLVMGIAYFAGFESSKHQATLGKKAMGLIVTDTQGRRLSFLRALGRYAAKILSALILLIGYIMVAFTARKQGLHDLLAGTLVVRGEPGSHSAAEVFD